MNTAGTFSRHGITLPMEQIAEFCRRWKVWELAVFGSFLRDDFRPDSDLDFLYTFNDNAHWTVLDLDTMEQELAAIVGRDVDFVCRSSVERSANYIRRRHIMSTAVPIYVEG
jgi:predicted nucleotidyltransferase